MNVWCPTSASRHRRGQSVSATASRRVSSSRCVLSLAHPLRRTRRVKRHLSPFWGPGALGGERDGHDRCLLSGDRSRPYGFPPGVKVKPRASRSTAAPTALSPDYSTTANRETFAARRRPGDAPREDIARLEGRRMVGCVEWSMRRRGRLGFSSGWLAATSSPHNPLLAVPYFQAADDSLARCQRAAARASRRNGTSGSGRPAWAVCRTTISTR